MDTAQVLPQNGTAWQNPLTLNRPPNEQYFILVCKVFAGGQNLQLQPSHLMHTLPVTPCIKGAI